MKVEIHRGEAPWDAAAERALKHAVRETEARARRYPQFWSELDVHVDDVRDGLEEIKLSLVVSGHQITVDRFGRDVPELVRDAFGELFRKFDGYRLATNRTLRERVERRLARREETGPGNGAGVRQVLVIDAYPVLLRIAEHEIAVRQIDGDLEPGLMDPVELADTVLAEGLAGIDADMTLPQAVDRLQQHLVALLDENVADIHEHEVSDVSLDSPVEPDFAMSELAEDLQYTWVAQTMDDTLLEDVLQDPAAPDPEVLSSRQELRDALVHALFTLTGVQRRLFSQVVIDGWATDAVSAARDVDEIVVRAEVDDAAHALARALSTGTNRWSADRVIEVYGALGEQLRDERRELAPTAQA